MKVIIGLIAGIMALVAVIFIGASGEKVSETSNNQNQDAVISLFKSPKEKIAKDALWVNNGRTLRIGVINDGTRRDGYADYVCQTIKEYGFKGVRVIINDIVKITRDNDWVELGSARCAK